MGKLKQINKEFVSTYTISFCGKSKNFCGRGCIPEASSGFCLSELNEAVMAPGVEAGIVSVSGVKVLT